MQSARGSSEATVSFNCRRESLVQKLALMEPKQFLQEIRDMNSSNTSLSSCVGGVSGKEEIADLWRQHFEKLFDCIQG